MIHTGVQGQRFAHNSQARHATDIYGNMKVSSRPEVEQPKDVPFAFEVNPGNKCIDKSDVGALPHEEIRWTPEAFGHNHG